MIPPVLIGGSGEMGCPVCGAVSAARTCGGCGWELLGELVMGSATPVDRRSLEDRLAAARRLLDVRAAVRAARGCPAEQERALFALAGTTPDSPDAGRARSAVPELMPMDLATALKDLPADEDVLVAEIGPDGLVLGGEVIAWDRLIPSLSSDPLSRRFQLAGGRAAELPGRDALEAAIDASLPAARGEKAVVILERCPDWPLAARLAAHLAARYAAVKTVTTDAPAAAVAARLAGGTFLPHDYALVLARPGQVAGGFLLEPRTLFPAGIDAGSAAVAEVRVCAPPAPGGVERIALKIPVVALTGERRDGWKPVRIVELDLAPGESATLAFTLNGPGRVDVAASTGTVRESAASWSGLLTELDQARLDLPLDLVVLVELGGPRNHERVAAVVDIVEHVQRGRPGGQVRVAVILYWDHEISKRRGAAPKEEPPSVTPFQNSADALNDLRFLLDSDYSADYEYPEAVALEDALHAVEELETWRHGDRALLVSATRAPHPAGDQEHKTMVRRCPLGLDWRTALTEPSDWLGRTVLLVDSGARPANMHEREAARRAEAVWEEFRAARWDLVSHDDDDAIKTAANTLAPPSAVARPVPIPFTASR